MNSLVIALLAGCLSSFNGWTVPLPQDTPAVRKSLPAKQGGALEIDVEPGSVELEPWDKQEVVVETDDIDEQHPERLSMTQSGNAIHVQYKDRRWSTGNIQFHINLPAEFSVNIRTSGGNVVQRDWMKGSLTVNTQGGNIEIERHAGNVDAHSGGGNIKADSIDGDALFKTGGGNVTVRATTGMVNVESGGGNIHVMGVRKSLDIRTGGGSITLGDIEGTSKVHTGGGSLRTGRLSGVAQLETGGGNIEVLGASQEMNVKSGGGTVKLHQIAGPINVTTGGGNIDIDLLASSGGQSLIHSGGGDILLSIPENAHASIHALVTERSSWGSRHKRIDIRSEFKADSFDRKDDEIEATYTLNGGGHSVDVETSNGIINIRKLK